MSRATDSPRPLHLSPAPTMEPRADGADWHPEPTEDGDAGPSPYVQGALAVDFRTGAYDSYFGPQATGTQDLPDARTWARRMILATLEACDGSRSAEQLRRWLTPDLRERVARRGQLARRRGLRRPRPPHVRTLLTCHPDDGICEVSAVVWAEGRIRALAVRMCGVDGRWLITAFELG